MDSVGDRLRLAKAYGIDKTENDLRNVLDTREKRDVERDLICIEFTIGDACPRRVDLFNACLLNES